MNSALHTVALAGSPAAWAFVALLVLIVFMPGVLPSLARLAGRLMQKEVRRRLGVAEPPPSEPPRRRTAVEVIPPAPARPQPHRPAPPDIIDVAPLPPRKRHRSLWWTAAIVLSLAAVLSWILFHPR